MTALPRPPPAQGPGPARQVQATAGLRLHRQRLRPARGRGRQPPARGSRGPPPARGRQRAPSRRTWPITTVWPAGPLPGTTAPSCVRPPHRAPRRRPRPSASPRRQACPRPARTRRPSASTVPLLDRAEPSGPPPFACGPVGRRGSGARRRVSTLSARIVATAGAVLRLPGSALTCRLRRPTLQAERCRSGASRVGRRSPSGGCRDLCRMPMPVSTGSLPGAQAPSRRRPPPRCHRRVPADARPKSWARPRPATQARAAHRAGRVDRERPQAGPRPLPIRSPVPPGWPAPPGPAPDGAPR